MTRAVLKVLNAQPKKSLRGHSFQANSNPTGTVRLPDNRENCIWIHQDGRNSFLSPNLSNAKVRVGVHNNACHHCSVDYQLLYCHSRCVWLEHFSDLDLYFHQSTSFSMCTDRGCAPVIQRYRHRPGRHNLEYATTNDLEIEHDSEP